MSICLIAVTGRDRGTHLFPVPIYPLPVCRDPPMQLMSAMIQKMGDKEETPLPQENMDGCESDEWSD